MTATALRMNDEIQLQRRITSPMTTIVQARPLAAAIVFVLGCAAPISLSALTIPLDRQRVPTTIDGVEVDLFVTGPVEISFAEGKAMVAIDATIDLADVQRSFAAIVRARGVDVRCGTSVSLNGAAIRPVQAGGGTIAEVTGAATIRQTACRSGGTPVDGGKLITGGLTVRISALADEHERLLFDLTVANATDAAVAKLLEQSAIREVLTKMLTGALAAAAGPSRVTAPLSSDAASYEPRVKRAAFQSLTGGALGARLAMTLSVPLDKFFEWKVGR
jgi:hypothetical protein